MSMADINPSAALSLIGAPAILFIHDRLDGLGMGHQTERARPREREPIASFEQFCP